MQLELLLNPASRSRNEDCLSVGDRQISVVLHRNPRARRYVLRLRPDGSARVTIPRGGSAAEARRFAERSVNWLGRQLQRLPTHPVRSVPWSIGTEILFRGEWVKIEAGDDEERGVIQLANEVFKLVDPAEDLRPGLERELRSLAAKELPARVLEFAAQHQLPVRRISVRDQRSRWGSCSLRGTISLNWRLIQAPPFVRDYLILHELTHLREMNHSARFWREVERVCPDYEIAERWLKQYSKALM